MKLFTFHVATVHGIQLLRSFLIFAASTDVPDTGISAEKAPELEPEASGAPATAAGKLPPGFGPDQQPDSERAPRFPERPGQDKVLNQRI